jgi:hypothetical protein
MNRTTDCTRTLVKHFEIVLHSYNRLDEWRMYTWYLITVRGWMQELNTHIKFKYCDTIVGPIKITVFHWNTSQTSCLCKTIYEVNGNEWAKINARNLILYIFCATVQYTQTFTSNLLHSIDYSLLLHVSTTGYGHLRGAKNFIDILQVVTRKW